MGIILGIDVGGSTTKIVGLNTNGTLISTMMVRAYDQITSPPTGSLSAMSRRYSSQASAHLI